MLGKCKKESSRQTLIRYRGIPFYNPHALPQQSTHRSTHVCPLGYT